MKVLEISPGLVRWVHCNNRIRVRRKYKDEAELMVKEGTAN